MSDVTVRSAVPGDLGALAAFMRGQGNTTASATYLRHWYFGNPSGSASVIIGEREGRIVGMATTNDHVFHREGRGSALVAMPQKVLTDAAERGRGIFGRLYRASEEACVARGVDHFLTVTNAASTPIFLGKFGYVRLPSPRLLLFPASPFGPRSHPAELPGPPPERPAGSAWSMRKDAAHFTWRYAAEVGGHVRIRSVGPPEAPLATVITRKLHKKGVPFLLVHDVLLTEPRHTSNVIDALRRLAWQERCVAVMLLKEGWCGGIGPRWTPRWERSSGFNLLVKGRDTEHTRMLAQEPFELAFGDLDFL